MLTSVRFENYRCLRDATIRLAPLTALVGPNASGKTTVLRGLREPSGDYRWPGAPPETVARTLQGHSWGRQVSIWPDLPEYAYVRLDLNLLRQPNVVAHQARLAEDGSNLGNVFASLTRKQQIA